MAKKYQKRRFIIENPDLYIDEPYTQIIEFKTSESSNNDNDDLDLYSDYLWEKYIRRSFFDVVKAYFSKKKKKYKLHENYVYKVNDEINYLLNRNFFEAYFDYLSKKK